MFAMKKAGKEPFPTIYVDGKEDGQVSSYTEFVRTVTLPVLRKYFDRR